MFLRRVKSSLDLPSLAEEVGTTPASTSPGGESRRPLPPIPQGQGPIDRPQSSPPIVYNCTNMSGANNNSFPALDTSFNNRSPVGGGPQANGAGMNSGGMNNYVPAVPVGHQQDLNFLFQQFQELQAQLASNREKVNDITRTAEEVARRANVASNGEHGDCDHETDKAKIRELEHETAKLNRIIELYKHEQRENTSLIAQYEDALGTATEQIRNYCNGIDTKFLAQRRHYNDLLQAEKDEHLASRLDRDHWHAQTLELCGMIRTANRLRTDEWCDEYRVVVGLQTEVRCFRRILGLEPERLEDETGWPYLRDAPFNDQA